MAGNETPWQNRRGKFCILPPDHPVSQRLKAAGMGTGELRTYDLIREMASG